MEGSDIVWLDGGRTHVGTGSPEVPFDGETPKRQVTIRAFGLSRFAVSVAEFSRFVDETGWTTYADRYGWSYVFTGLLEDGEGPSPRGLPWWKAVDGANWRFPAGPSGGKALKDHPVTHISHDDAEEYASWAWGKTADRGRMGTRRARRLR